jgi:RND family efflux transporter MFP subunit
MPRPARSNSGSKLRALQTLRAASRRSQEMARLAFVLALAALIPGCKKPSESARQTPPSVTVSQPLKQEVTNYVELTGTAASSKTVDLVARVTGYLRSVNFQEGFFVEEGKELFVIEPEPFEQQVNLAKAAHERAKLEYERQASLLESNATSKANLEKWQSERDMDLAQLKLAEINLGYTRVKAPFTGRISRRFVDPGNLVGPGATVKLATLDQVAPIYVNFSLNERDALRIREVARTAGRDPQFQQGKLPVWVGAQNEQGYSQEGVLDYIDTGIDPSMGTVLLRGAFTNEQYQLFPGLFVRVRLNFGLPEPMLVVPNSAIGNDQEGDYVLVVAADDLVTRRTVVKGPLTHNGCAIRTGINPEDRVIVDGLSRAKPGTKVTPVNATAAQAAPAKPAP